MDLNTFHLEKEYCRSLMKYNLSFTDLETIDYNRCFENRVIDKSFFGRPGKEHYKLLSYLSTLFQNSPILSLGTELSALALSYNINNTIYSFHSSSSESSALIDTDNIHWRQENIGDVKIFEQWKPLIMSCPFVFLSLDAHNGFSELEWIQRLQEINYTGFVVCDNIWYFKEMRDGFWYQIEDACRYDLTHLGHFTGTGIVTLNPHDYFPKYDLSNWTLVTAYFNLTQCSDASREIRNRDKNYYMSYASSTLNLPHNLVIYCDEESLEQIQSIRPAYLAPKTRYILWNFEEICFQKNGKCRDETFRDYRQEIIKNRLSCPDSDPRCTPSYYLFCMSRYIMLKDSIDKNPFGSTHYAWINFCIERMGYSNLVRLEEALDVYRDRFSTCYIDYQPEQYVREPSFSMPGTCTMCSGFFTGRRDYMYEVCDLLEDKFLEFKQAGYGHADEQLYSAVYFQHPNLFEHYYGDYHQMITNYKYVYEAPEAPIFNFIRNSFENAYPNIPKCYEACQFLFQSWALDKCEISQQNLYHLFYYMGFCKKILKDI